MGYYLLRKGNYENPLKIPLSGLEVVVGRRNYPEFCTAPFISRRHAEFISSSDGQWFVTDLNSTNGVFVNGQRVDRPLHCIKVGDSIGLGVAHATANNEFEFIVKLDIKTEIEEDDDDIMILEEFTVSRPTESFAVKIKTEEKKTSEQDYSAIINNQPTVVLMRCDPLVETLRKEKSLSKSSSHKRVSKEQKKHPKKARRKDFNVVETTSSSESDVEISIKKNFSSFRKKELTPKKAIIGSSDSSCEEPNVHVSPSLSGAKQVGNHVQNDIEMPKSAVFPPASTPSTKVANHMNDNLKIRKSTDLLSCLPHALKVNEDVHCNFKIPDFTNIPPRPVKIENPCPAAEETDCSANIKKEIEETEDDFEDNLGYSQIAEVIIISDDDEYLNFPASQEGKDINLQLVKIEPVDCDDTEYEYNAEKINDQRSDEEPFSESIDAIKAFISSKSGDNSAKVKEDHMKAPAVNGVAQNQEDNLDFFPILSQNFYSGPNVSPNENLPCEDNETSCSNNSKHKNNLTKVKGAKRTTAVLTDPMPMQYRPRYQRGREEWFEERYGKDNSEKTPVLPPKSTNKKTAKPPAVTVKKLKCQKPAAEKKKKKNKKDFKERIKEQMGHRIRAPSGGSAIRLDSNKPKHSSDSIKKSTCIIPSKKIMPTIVENSKSLQKNAENEMPSLKNQHYKLDRFSSRTKFLTMDTASTSEQKKSKIIENSANGYKIPKTKTAKRSANDPIKKPYKSASEALHESSSVTSVNKCTDKPFQGGKKSESCINANQSTKSDRNLEHVNPTLKPVNSRLSHSPQKSDNYRNLVYPNLNHHANLAAHGAKDGSNDMKGKVPNKLPINAISPYYWRSADYQNSVPSHQAVNFQNATNVAPPFHAINHQNIKQTSNHQNSVSSSHQIVNPPNTNSNISPTFHSINHQKSKDESASYQTADHQNSNSASSLYESLNHQNSKKDSLSFEIISNQNSNVVLPFHSDSLNRDPRVKDHANKTLNRIGVSSSSHAKELCVVKPNNAGDDRKRILGKPLWLDFDSVLAKVLNWNPMWLKEYKRISVPPPVITKGIAPLPTAFSSLDDYNRCFYPMILLELWEHVFRQWDQIEHAKNSRPEVNLVFFMVTDSISKGDILVLNCESLVFNNATFYPREGNLIIVDLFDETRKNYVKVFGYVTTHKVENIGSTRLHHVWLQRPESRSTEFRLYKFSLKTKKRLVAYEKLMKAYILCYVANSVRLADGLQHLSASQLTQDILQPSEKTCKLNLKHRELSSDVTGKYNPVQTSVINSVTDEMKTAYRIPKIILLQGPPGTGKTHTLIGVIQNLILDKSVKILVTAPSNAAVDEIGKRLLQAKKRRGDKLMKIVRVGLLRQIHKEMIPYTIENLAESNSRRNDNLEMERLKKLLEEKRKCIEKVERDLRMNLSPTETRMMQNKLSMEKRRKQTCIEDIRRISHGSRSNEAALYADKIKILENANIVLSTLGSCRLKILEKVFGMRSQNHFTCCIIDEAAQCTEPEALQPLVFGLAKFVLVGDHCQLPATVFSKIATECNYDRSWFHRIHLDFRKRNVDSPVFMLTEQYRMHPEICSFPSSYFYDKKLTTSPLVINRHSFPLKPFIILNIIEGQESNVSSSKENFHEANAIVAICDGIYRTLSNLAYSVGIITPYLGQKELILRKFKENNFYSHNVEVNTVDSFQGREKDVIILSCVRARSADGSIGFVECERRLNVAITRAKYCLIICGHMNSLDSHSHWRALITYAKQRKAYVPMTSLHDVPFIISDMKRA